MTSFLKQQVTIGLLLIGIQIIWTQPAQGVVRLPKLVSDGMVLQRDAEVNIWRWVSQGEDITIRFMAQVFRTVTGENNDCSGQSNMVLPMDRLKPLYEDVIDQSENDNIRYFRVPMTYDFDNPQEELPASPF